MARQRPPTTSYGNGLGGEANGDVRDRQAAILERRLMSELVSGPDLGPPYLPEPNDIDELRIVCEQLRKIVHVMPIPGVRERRNDFPHFLLFDVHG